jgi:SAM-dependent methyltransferase
MASVRDHYNRHLGPIYSWMAGEFESASQQSAAIFDELDLRSSNNGIAVDLGAGHGLQSIPLARRGFNVFAIDQYAPLLAEMSTYAVGLAITPIVADIQSFKAHIPGKAEVIVCMGDTLTHLPSFQSVETLIKDAAAMLNARGLLICTFRDYVSAELEGNARFIPMRSDDQQILTCFLEYEPQTVRVHDILHKKQGAAWESTVSSYKKLRLSQEWVTALMMKMGFQIIRQAVDRGLITLVGQAR